MFYGSFSFPFIPSLYFYLSIRFFFLQIFTFFNKQVIITNTVAMHACANQPLLARTMRGIIFPLSFFIFQFFSSLSLSFSFSLPLPPLHTRNRQFQFPSRHHIPSIPYPIVPLSHYYFTPLIAFFPSCASHRISLSAIINIPNLSMILRPRAYSLQ